MTENERTLRSALGACREFLLGFSNKPKEEILNVACAALGATTPKPAAKTAGEVCPSTVHRGKWVAYLPDGNPVFVPGEALKVALFDTAEEAAECLRDKP